MLELSTSAISSLMRGEDNPRLGVKRSRITPLQNSSVLFSILSWG
ncbi:hypothetical protein [Microcoleus sp. FACHB-831]|nr:hypothetical protein [Microcoleus sp. FACHB-831]